MTSTAKHADRVLARCAKLAAFSEDSNALGRTFLSPPMRNCHQAITEWVQPLGAIVRIDAAGNLRAHYPGADDSAPSLLIGSHLDTVPNAGAYDGVLGVVLAIELLECLEGNRLPFAIEVVGFSEEEGVRYGIPFIGSRALIGRLDDTLLNRKDANGISVREAIENFGLNPARIPEACIGDDVLGYLEFHIEQGPVLEELGLPLAIVEAIVGQSRLELSWSGQTNHAGTTPMRLRRDALAGAAEWIVAVERVAQAQDGLVATVGAIAANPGVTNAVAGEARVSLDLRHASDAAGNKMVSELMAIAEEIAVRRHLRVSSRMLLDQGAVEMDPFLIKQIAAAMRQTGCEPHRMASGAGHDAMILAEKVPPAMIFLRTPNGVSHHPSESVLPADVSKALDCGLHLLTQLASSEQFLKRTCRA